MGGGGGPSVPFYSVCIAKALGVEQVDYIDRDSDRLAKAEALGAQGRLHPEVVTDAVVDWDSAPAALTGERQKLVIHRPDG